MTRVAGVNAPQVVPIGADQDVVRVRQAVRSAAVAARLSLVDQTKIITAASELARNTLVHGGGGRAEVTTITDQRRAGLRLTFVDEGPGIADPDAAMADGFTTSGGLGLGLSGSRRLVDDFDIQTAPGQGTRVTITKWGR